MVALSPSAEVFPVKVKVQRRPRFRFLERLAHGESVTSVAFDVGYGDVSSFIALFKAALELIQVPIDLEEQPAALVGLRVDIQVSVKE
jgi:methylphosphotriester-DNA--protein-cysteine methyltransferase